MFLLKSLSLFLIIGATMVLANHSSSRQDDAASRTAMYPPGTPHSNTWRMIVPNNLSKHGGPYAGTIQFADLDLILAMRDLTLAMRECNHIPISKMPRAETTTTTDANTSTYNHSSLGNPSNATNNNSAKLKLPSFSDFLETANNVVGILAGGVQTWLQYRNLPAIAFIHGPDIRLMGWPGHPQAFRA